jgi:hypothetical protein
MRDIFISYSRGDQPFVKLFVRSLQDAGVRTWFDLDDLLPGQKWENEIEDRIADAKIFLPFFSESAAERRGYFQSEQVIALKAAMRVPSDQIYLMPALLGSVAIPRDMRQYHAVDLSADGAMEKMAQALSAALDRKVTLSSERCASLLEALKYHLGYEAKTNKEFVASFMNPEISIADSVALLERLANSRDSTRLATLLDLRANANLSMAEHRALDIAVDHVQRGQRVDALFDSAVVPEKLKIVAMKVPGSAVLTQQLVVNKYVRFTSRRDSALHAMAQKKIVELIAQGIDALE